MADHPDLQRFVDAQRDRYDTALLEVQQGAKRSHWMWFIFPQIAGLGNSAMAQRYAIASLVEARAYLAHPVLGKRLQAITNVLQDLPEPDAERVFGTIDAMKLHSSLTLFARAENDPNGHFQTALDRWFEGKDDPATLSRL
jgi:uncharacterized protein (DUF1810 family)